LAQFSRYLARLQSVDADLELITGLIEIGSGSSSGAHLTSGEVAALEPSLLAPLGGRLHSTDAAIDIGRLLSALRRVVSTQPSIAIISSDPAIRVDVSASRPNVTLRGG